MPSKPSSESVDPSRPIAAARLFARRRAVAGAVLAIFAACLTGPARGDTPAPSSAAIPTEVKGWAQRHSEKVKAVRAHKYDLLLIGDSITNNLDIPQYSTVWKEFYAPRNAIDLGYGGDRTENILWNLQNGELDNQSPKVAVLLIGTNNSDDANYKDVSTAEQIAEGTAAIVKVLRERLPTTRIVLLRIFPRQNRYFDGKVERGSAERRWAINLRASELAAKLADDKHVFYLDVNHIFLRLDGTIDPDLMPDLLHPSPKGARLWAQAMDPLLTELMGDKPLDPDVTKNTALIPTPKLENDSYDWWQRHAEELAAREKINPQIVLIGDSITHFWGGLPKAATQNGPRAWAEAFGSRPVQNLGFGWDRTQNVLWRLDHGEFDGLHPKVVVLNIGTNNLTGTAHARENSPREIDEAIVAICGRIRSKSPDSRIIVMGVFPRGQKPGDAFRPKIAELNQLLAKGLANVKQIQFLDIGPQLLEPDGTISNQIMGDYTHPTEKGYAIWAKALLAAGITRADVGSLKQAKPDRVAFVGESSAPDGAPLCLWYRRPAEHWLEALPVGNGRIGAMVYGGVDQERLALNEVSLWCGAPSDQHENPESPAAFKKFRELFWSGRRGEAAALVPKLLGRELNYGTNLPGGDLLLDQTGIGGEIHDYRRELNLDEAVAKVSFTSGGVRFTREVLASHPQGVLAMRLSADHPGMLNFALHYRSGRLPCQQQTEGGDTLVVDGRAFGPHSDGKSGVAFRAMFRVLADGGGVRADGQTLTVTGATAATVLVAFNTDFHGREPASLCTRQIAAAAEIAWPRLRGEHVADQQRLFRRVSLDLGGEPAAGNPTDARLESLRQGHADPQLTALFFQYGRYLTIAGSRPDSPLPMHLQGIWNDDVACNMGWTCDYHLDINTQQNYWATEVCNLSECGEPLFRLVESLQAPGHRTARATYGIEQGWVCHVFTNAWGFTAPGWSTGWGLQVTGGAWIATHLWEHYQFTGDKDFLAHRAYPVLKGAAEFFLEYLAPDPKTGLLYTGPSVSPERGGETTLGPTCDRAIVYDLFSECIEASRVLSIDEDFRARLEAARAKLPPYRIGRNGQLQEWEQDDGGETNHRHTSHLVGLFPLAQITPQTTPDLAKAASKSLELRMGRKDWEDVEWSRANAINYQARLLNGDQAEASVTELIRKLAGKNLLTISVAGIAGAATDVFSIDGNCAGTAGIAEMLLQSHERTADGRFILDLLPALPKVWPAGEVRGLRARGGFEVDETWQDGRLKRATVKRPAGSGRAILRYGSQVREVNLDSGESTDWEPAGPSREH